ncbi:peptide ABC transporter permease [Oceanobacillus oncorhynchi subsp. incaldanensis]|uniref:Nickel transport system permease protein NikC n=2 Tax=Oceanobacillus TaxID=182709 RepID=A0A0A1MUL4_9BACI|nr:nickel/cobalt ABC transporter permease [Oceanobacillus oncorhynchi]MDM8101843.1 nickel ABC transporter permease subunit NikC [Oceanobacillus oncorhynchi]UUI41694.1 nickel ABC transporter permease subunit NikC [Oceanobacillus oncorhynchi]GIO20554.1 peptide ABC transporter permease [Oceanobacillus oncorhynchi subsp. incaldanensis]CEI83212.1 Nickel transport system permease protein NikC [Oceanobacillus oncorhynchi]
MGGLNKLMRDRSAMICIIFLTLVVLAGIFAPWLAPHSPIDVNVKEKLAGISTTYPLGTDQLGRCIFSRLLYGIRTTVFIAFITMIVTIVIGTLIGGIAGLFRGKIDEIIMRICDVFMSFPSEVMILAIIGMMGPGLTNIVIASIIAKWAWYTRMVRSIIIKYADKNYIQFARVSGFSRWHIFKKHIMPNTVGEISVLATLDAGSVILMISALSFLGLGVQAPTPEWGMMLNEAKNVMTIYPELMLAPGIAILVVVAAFNFLGDSLQDAFNVKRGKRGKRMR